MAFSAARTVTFHCGGGKTMSMGTFTQTAATDSGGEITAAKTGLKYIDSFVPVCNSHLGTEGIKVTINSSSAGAVTLVTSTGAVSGYWIAVGL